MGASRPLRGGTGLFAPIFFALASHRKIGFPLQSIARQTDIRFRRTLNNVSSTSASHPYGGVRYCSAGSAGAHYSYSAESVIPEEDTAQSAFSS
jgi:hypothetical protein